jgi:hypothetical protein
MPSTPGLPLLALTRFNARLQFSRSQTSSINDSVMAGFSVPRFAADDSVPAGSIFGASPLSSSPPGQLELVFLPPVVHESRCLLAAPLTLLTEDRLGLRQFPAYFARC